jgi:hypothetical protein
MTFLRRGQGVLKGVSVMVGIFMLAGCTPVPWPPVPSGLQAKQTISRYHAMNYTYCRHCVHYTKLHELH